MSGVDVFKKTFEELAQHFERDNKKVDADLANFLRSFVNIHGEEAIAAIFDFSYQMMKFKKILEVMVDDT